MALKTAEKPKTSETEIKRDAQLARQTSGVPEEYQRRMDEDAGKGSSTDAADNLVPMAYVLQSLSPQVLDDSPARIEGARPGDIWLRNAAGAIVRGSVGLPFMPVRMYQRWVRWIPRTRGGGFVESYDFVDDKTYPAGVVRRPVEDKPNRFRLVFSDSGDECTHTRYEAGIFWRDGQPMPYVIPFKSTGHSISRGWMTKKNSLKTATGKIRPVWSSLYVLRTGSRKNISGQWFVFEVGDPISIFSTEGAEIVGGNVSAAYDLGRDLNMAFETGAKREEAETSVGEESASSEERDAI